MTTKKKPHYPLPDVKKLVEQEQVLISRAAREDAALLGIDRQGILETILKLSLRLDFSTSTSGYTDPSAWQDAYITWYNDNNIYLKFFIRKGSEDDDSPTRLIVTSFKTNTN